MKKSINLFIILLILLNPYQSISQQNCLADDAELNQLMADFEKNLKSYYNLDKEPQNEDYKKYLNEIIQEAVPRDFFTDPQKLDKAKSLKETEYFSLIWNKMSLIEEQTKKKSDAIEIEPPKTASGNDIRKKKDFYTIDPYSDVYNCLIEQTEGEYTKALLRGIQELGGLYPKIIAQNLVEINDFEDRAIRTYVSLQFYYDFIFLLSGINKIE